jgi:hypothetical protein
MSAFEAVDRIVFSLPPGILSYLTDREDAGKDASSGDDPSDSSESIKREIRSHTRGSFSIS